MTLKSTRSQMKNRGYIDEGDLSEFKKLSKETILGLSKSGNAFERTDAIRFLAGDPSEDLIHIDLLTNEKTLLSFYEAHKIDPLIKWKCIRTFQSFRSDAVMDLLKSLMKEEKDAVLKKEAERSINRINAKKARNDT